MTTPLRHPLTLGILGALVAGLVAACEAPQAGTARAANPSDVAMSPALIAEGQRVFRFDTFGDEQQWTDVLRMHEAVGTVSPNTALSVGLSFFTKGNLTLILSFLSLAFRNTRLLIGLDLLDIRQQKEEKGHHKCNAQDNSSGPRSAKNTP